MYVCVRVGACMQVAPRLSAAELMDCSSALRRMQFGDPLLLLPALCDAMKERLMEAALARSGGGSSGSSGSASGSSISSVPPTAILQFLDMMGEMGWPVPPQTASLLKRQLQADLSAKAADKGKEGAPPALDVGYGGADLDGQGLSQLLTALDKVDVEVDPPLLQVRPGPVEVTMKP